MYRLFKGYPIHPAGKVNDSIAVLTLAERLTAHAVGLSFNQLDRLDC